MLVCAVGMQSRWDHTPVNLSCLEFRLVS
jgi:hypothetical protein